MKSFMKLASHWMQSAKRRWTISELGLLSSCLHLILSCFSPESQSQAFKTRNEGLHGIREWWKKRGRRRVEKIVHFLISFRRLGKWCNFRLMNSVDWQSFISMRFYRLSTPKSTWRKLSTPCTRPSSLKMIFTSSSTPQTKRSEAQYKLLTVEQS